MLVWFGVPRWRGIAESVRCRVSRRSVLWGIPGAVLSVPIMVVILIVLKTAKHPVATALVSLMRGKFGEETLPEEQQLVARRRRESRDALVTPGGGFATSRPHQP